MYETIEANIKNGRVTTAEAGRLPKEAHVLITFLDVRRAARAESESTQSLRGALKSYADSGRREQEHTAWALGAEKKHAVLYAHHRVGGDRIATFDKKLARLIDS